MGTAAFDRKQFLRLAAAWLLPVLVGAAQGSLWAAFRPFPWFSFFLAVFFVALIGGLWGGVGATVLSTLIVWYFFLPPKGSFALDRPSSILSLVIFVIIGVAFSMFHHRQRQRDEKYRTLFDHAADGIVVVDANARLVDANPAYCAMQGRPQAEVVGAALEALTDHTPEHWDVVNDNLRHDGRASFERQLHRGNGTGMSEEQLASIFRPFAQGDQSLARRFEGLGLAYVHEMVVRLGGTIAVTSAAGEGSRFAVTLPVRPV